MFSVEATRAPTLTEAPWPNRTPFGLTRKTLPFALRLRFDAVVDGVAQQVHQRVFHLFEDALVHADLAALND